MKLNNIYSISAAIMNLEEYYAIEDFGSLLSIQTCLQSSKSFDSLLSFKNTLNKNKKFTNTIIRANFQVDGRAKEILMEKRWANKIYAFCKIYSENNKFINILINRKEKYDTNEILKKINEIKTFKGAIKICLNIDEYPIKSYYLEEKKLQNIDNNTDKIEKDFILKKINQRQNNLNQNNLLSNNLKFLNCNTTEIIVNNINQNIFNNKINNQNFNLLGTNTFYGQNININNGAIINNNNNQNNNYNFNQNNNYNFNQNNNKINFKNNFYNNNNINNNFNQNNNMNLMGSNNIIQYILENNKFLLQLIINFIHQNNNNPINSNLLQMTNNLIKINNNIQNDFNNMILMKQNIIFLLSNLNQINNNNMNQLYMNNNNQVSNYLKPIINCLNQIDNNINNIIKFYNNNYYQINNNNNFKNNDVLDNNNNKISKKHNEGEKKENKNYDDSNFLFKDYDGYFPLIGLKNVDSICYMNSILQCLLHIPQLNGFFINIYPEQKSELQKINKDIETRGRLCEEYHKIVIDIYKIQGFKRSYISPKDFINFLSQISGQFEEIDAKDFLSYLFQTMHSELNYLGDKKLINLPKCNQLIEKESFNFFMSVSNNLNLSIISYLFNGILKSTTICKSCKKTFYNFQFFQFLNFKK